MSLVWTYCINETSYSKTLCSETHVYDYCFKHKSESHSCLNFKKYIFWNFEDGCDLSWACTDDWQLSCQLTLSKPVSLYNVFSSLYASFTIYAMILYLMLLHASLVKMSLSLNSLVDTRVFFLILDVITRPLNALLKWKWMLKYPVESPASNPNNFVCSVIMPWSCFLLLVSCNWRSVTWSGDLSCDSSFVSEENYRFLNIW